MPNLLAQTFNSSFRYNVLPLNDPRFDDNRHLIYPNVFEIKDTTDVQNSASYLLIVTRQVPLVEQKLLILPEHPNSPGV